MRIFKKIVYLFIWPFYAEYCNKKYGGIVRCYQCLRMRPAGLNDECPYCGEDYKVKLDSYL